VSRSRRAAAACLAGAVSVTMLAGCGGHRAAAPPAPATASPTTAAAPRHHASARRRVLAPLTGLVVKPATARRGAVVVKIDNVTQALPQTGVAEADVVYEEMVEGGLTRLAAVFQSAYPKLVGPVRSGRLTDEGIADDLGHPVLAYAGANAIFQPILAAQPVHVVDADNYPGLFHRDYARPAPHNLYADVAALAHTVREPTPPPQLWGFRPAGQQFDAPGARAAHRVTIDFPAATVSWTWDGREKRWLRTQDGSADVDSAGARLSAPNVVVQWVPYVTSAYVSGEGAASGAAIPKGVQVGSGVAWYLSGGRLARGHWHRRALDRKTVFTDDAGRPIRLATGPTWVELPPLHAPVAVQYGK
jgi:hypothetical protein